LVRQRQAKRKKKKSFFFEPKIGPKAARKLPTRRWLLFFFFFFFGTVELQHNTTFSFNGGRSSIEAEIGGRGLHFGAWEQLCVEKENPCQHGI
jgi:hypothetical protein